MTDAITPAQQASIAAAAMRLRAGGLVGMPTETVYGLAASVWDPAAVLRIFHVKGRPLFDPLIVHVADAEQAWTVAQPNALARHLAQQCWPGPLTLVLPRQAAVPDLVTAGLDSVAVRCPDHLLALALIRAAGLPLAAPSANRFACLSPTRAADVVEQLGAAVDLVLDGGPCRVGVESTVLSLCGERPLILRPGGLTRERLEALLDSPVGLAARTILDEGSPPAPGMLASHYAPRCPLRLRRGDEAWPKGGDLGLLAFTGADLPPAASVASQEILSWAGDPAQAAMELFAALRRLDRPPVRRIVAELLPEQGLGLAINDRLRRAAGLG